MVKKIIFWQIYNKIICWITDFACPVISEEYKNYADPTNCSKYYECHQGRKTSYSCPPGFLFNPVEGRCDFSSNVNCSKFLNYANVIGFSGLVELKRITFQNIWFEDNYLYTFSLFGAMVIIPQKTPIMDMKIKLQKF